MVVDTQFHKFYGRPFARVLYLFLMKMKVGDSPGCYQDQQDNFYNDDAVHNHSAHGYYITHIEEGVRYAGYSYMVNRIK